MNYVFIYFFFRMKIRHRSEKIHQNADDLLRLSSKSKKKIVKIMFVKTKKQSKNDFVSAETDQVQKSKIDFFQFEINQNFEKNSDLKKKTTSKILKKEKISNQKKSYRSHSRSK